MTRFLLPAVLVAATGCAVNPATGQRELMLVSEGQEIGMGQNADPDIVGAYGLYPDSALQVYVRGLGERLAAQSDRPPPRGASITGPAGSCPLSTRKPS